MLRNVTDGNELTLLKECSEVIVFFRGFGGS